MKRDLSKFTEEELCEVYSNLNRWKWDARLGEKPRGWDRIVNWVDSTGGKSKHQIIRPIMNEITRRVSEYKLLQWHHIHNCGMTKEQSDVWMSRNLFNGNLP